MQQTKGLALEIRLSAYIDGELPEVERSELDALLSRDDNARALLERLRAGGTFGNKAFEDFLHDPVPLALVRQIKQGPGITPRFERVATVNLPRRNTRIWPRLAAASLVLLFLGGASGFILGSRIDTPVLAPETAERPWIQEVADHHRIYARQKRHLVEVPASQAAEIENWLTSSVGVAFKIPDLSRRGLTFEGARLLVAKGKPVGQLVYRDRDSNIFAICFLKKGGGEQPDQFSETIRGDLSLVSWEKENASFVVVGPSSDPALQDIAHAVAAAI